MVSYHNSHETLWYDCPYKGFLSISEKKNFNDLILWNTLIDSRRDSAGLSSVPKGRTGEQCRSKEFNYEVDIWSYKHFYRLMKIYAVRFYSVLKITCMEPNKILSEWLPIWR